MPSVVLNPLSGRPHGRRAPLAGADAVATPPAPPAAGAVPSAALDGPLHLADRWQWVSSTPGRIVGDGYSWLQAVHWVNGTKAYRPARRHGPKWGPTTMAVAQLLSELSPCRPGIEYLMRRTGLKERAVQYHLQMLREAGLLAYVVKGTRVRGERARASEFAWTIPPHYDHAAQIRTLGIGPQRRAVGIGKDGRLLVAKYAKKAARKVRQPSRRRPSGSAGNGRSRHERCTPMGGGTSRSSRAASTCLPPESKLESGNSSNSAPVKSPPHTLNPVGRRFQLARELVQQMPWLGQASADRIAWIVRDVSDAGWTAAEVIAVVGQDAVARQIHRPSGFLAHRLRGAHLLYNTAAKRAAIVAWWRDSRSAEQDRHAEWETTWQPPRSRAVTRLVTEAFTAAMPAAPCGPELPAVGGLEDLGEEDLRELRRTARNEYLSGRTTLVTSAVDLLGRLTAEHVYGQDLVERVLRLGATSTHLRLRTGVMA